MTPADGPATTASRPETARPLENLLFSAALVARRLPWADLPARTLGLHALTREGLTRRLVAHLRGGRDDGRPVRVRTPFGTFLVPLTRADAESLLTRGDGAGALGSPYGLAPDGRRYGLSPHAAPAGAWDVQAEDELGGLTAQVAEHLAPLTAARREDGALDGDRWRDAMLRLSRRVVLGAGAVEDTLLSEVVTAAADAAGGPSYEARAAAVRRRLAPYLADPGPGSLAGRLAARGRGTPETQAAVAHALALVSTATSTSALQALAVLAAGADSAPVPPEEALDQALDQVLDRYPPLSAVVYPVRAPLDGDGGPRIEAGTEILYVPPLLGRRAEEGRTDPAWALCGNPSGCAVARFALLVGREVLRGITAGAHPVLLSPRFTVDRLPDTFDPRAVVVALAASDGPATPAPLSAYGALGQGGADRLDDHARSLAACAADSGWGGSAVGERFRAALLEHADRCARAAADVRQAAGRLSE